MSDIKELEGQILSSVTMDKDNTCITFDQLLTKTQWVMQHQQDCCESVRVEDVVGDLQDLVGTPILLAEESSSNEVPKDVKLDYEPEHCTWTFYRFRTAKGNVTIRWYGSSNGYYSESVDFERVQA